MRCESTLRLIEFAKAFAELVAEKIHLYERLKFHEKYILILQNDTHRVFSHSCIIKSVVIFYSKVLIFRKLSRNLCQT